MVISFEANIQGQSVYVIYICMWLHVMCVDTQSNRRRELEEAKFRPHRQGAKCASQTVEQEGDGTAVCW